MFCALICNPVSTIQMPKLYSPWEGLSGNVHCARAVMRNKKSPIGTHIHHANSWAEMQTKHSWTGLGMQPVWWLCVWKGRKYLLGFKQQVQVSINMLFLFNPTNYYKNPWELRYTKCPALGQSPKHHKGRTDTIWPIRTWLTAGHHITPDVGRSYTPAQQGTQSSVQGL